MYLGVHPEPPQLFIKTSKIFDEAQCCFWKFTVASLHVRSNFWCLLMASTKLMLYVYITFCKLFFCKRNIDHCYLNFLFELPNQMSLIGSYSASLLLKILLLLKKCLAKLMKYNTSNNKLIKPLDYKSF